MDEKWKDIEGYEGVYQISSDGRVLSTARKGIKKIKSLRTCSNGYIQVNLSRNNDKKLFLVHRLVAKAFLPNPENKREVNHKNGIKSDNRVDNLEWVTPKENINHAIQNGLLNPDKNPEYLFAGWQRKREDIIQKIVARSTGENSPNHKRTNEQVLKMRQMYRDGMNIYEIAKAFGLHHSSVADIIKGKAWKHLPYDKIEKNLRKRSILRIKGKERKVFASIAEAAKEFLSTNKSAHSAISACCRGKRENYMGYKWCYIDNV